MAPSATNLIAGPAVAYIGPFGTTEPADTAVATAPGVGWTDIGGTDGGVKVAAARETIKLRMDQIREAPGRRITEVDVTISTSFAEPTLENWARSLAIPASSITTGGTGGTAYKAMDMAPTDDAGEEPDYFAMIVDGRAPGGKRRRVIGRKLLSAETVELEWKRDEQTFIPVTFAAHWVSASIKSVHVVDSTAV